MKCDVTCSRADTDNLITWLREALSPARALREGSTTAPSASVIFVGHSLGGALAQLTALRAWMELEVGLTARVHVLAFGAIQWANATTAAHFEAAFGPRAVQLITTEGRVSRFLRRAAPWWIPDGIGSFIVLDPLTLQFEAGSFPLHNNLACPVSGEKPAPDGDADFCPTGEAPSSLAQALSPHHLRAQATSQAQVGSIQLTSTKLYELLNNILEPTDPLQHDYIQLHRGMSYRAGLLGLYLRGDEARSAADTAGLLRGRTPTVSEDRASVGSLDCVSVASLGSTTTVSMTHTPSGNEVPIAAAQVSGETMVERVVAMGEDGNGQLVSAAPMRRSSSSKRSLVDMEQEAAPMLRRCSSSKRSLVDMEQDATPPLRRSMSLQRSLVGMEQRTIDSGCVSGWAESPALLCVCVRERVCVCVCTCMHACVCACVRVQWGLVHQPEPLASRLLIALH